MNKKLIKSVVCALLSVNILSACGDDVPATAPVITGYSSDQLELPAQNIEQAAPVQQTQKTVSQAKAKTNTNSKVTNQTTAKTKTTTTAKTPVTTTATNTLSTAQKIMLKTKQTYDGYKNFTLNLTMYSKRNDKTTPKATATANAEFKYIFQQPRLTHFFVIKHSISMAIGGQLVWKGDSEIRAKGAGALGLVPMTLPINDSKISTNRSWSFDKLDHVGMLSRALDKKAKLSLAGKSTINGKEAYMIKVTGTGLDDEITEENIAIDTKTFNIIADEMYAGKELVFQLKINIEGTNQTLPADQFEI